ncbi:MAG: hydrolase [Gammaproteobacteria bacterium]
MQHRYNSTFKPAWWLPGAHLQTIWPRFFRRYLARPLLQPERLELPDGDFVDLLQTEPGDGPLVLIFHGLEGGIHSHYTKPMIAALHRQGWQVVLMHFRGCSGEQNRLPRHYHSGDTGDIAFLIDTMHRRYPDRHIAAVGYSLGGNALLKYLGEADRAQRICAAAAISVPFSLRNGAERLKYGLSRIYQHYLISALQKKVTDKFADKTAPIRIDHIHTLNTFWDFDEHITAPLHGFSGAEEYYRLSSCKQFLHKITVPTLLLHAADDPFMTPEAIPTPPELSARVTLELSRHGGHVGFVGGKWPWLPIYWLEHRVPEFLKHYL